MEAKELKYKELPGLSERQLSEHHDVLYAGYVKKVSEIRDLLGKVDRTQSNPSYSEIRELKVELSFVLNGVRLHELYFENLGGSGEPTKLMSDRIASDFGTYESWVEEFTSLGLSARGWVILAENDEGKLENYLCDWHSQGGVWGAKPILVLDVYEHAYFLDYGTNRKGYVEAFMGNINWEAAEKRLP